MIKIHSIHVRGSIILICDKPYPHHVSRIICRSFFGVLSVGNRTECVPQADVQPLTALYFSQSGDTWQMTCGVLLNFLWHVQCATLQNVAPETWPDWQLAQRMKYYATWGHINGWKVLNLTGADGKVYRMSSYTCSHIHASHLLKWVSSVFRFRHDILLEFSFDTCPN